MFKSSSKDTEWLQKSLRLTNYVAASSLYLKENFWLENSISQGDIKDRIVGHWGTVPGLNLIYAGLNWLIVNQEKEKEVDQRELSSKKNQFMLIVGPGHGAPSILSNLWMEGTLGKYYPQYTENALGGANLIKNFSWPGGFPSHTYPGLPGSINEGGELGYSLGLAFGSVLDNPTQVTFCVVGDGEAETGALSTSWQSNKFLNQKKDGVVLPILHLNDYKISGPTILSRMSNENLTKYFEGLNYIPFFAQQSEDEIWLSNYLDTLALAYQQVLNYQAGLSDKLPVLLLRTLKGWTGPKFAGGAKIEGNNLSHGIPLKNPKKNKSEFEVLKNWLESYNVNELIDLQTGTISKSITDHLPQPENRLGMIQEKLKVATKNLIIPDFNALQIQTLVRGQNGNQMVHLSEFLSQIIDQNRNNFRVFSPDESESNRLETLYETTQRVFNLPLKPWDDNLGESGQIMEMLSEQTLQSWMQGYNAFGGHGILVSYEAFLAIIISQIDQYIKYLNQSLTFNWRGWRPSMNYFATSTAWRQDHNGFTHQNPILINTLLSKNVDFTNVYFPADTNIGLQVLDGVLASGNTVNLIVAGKTDLPQWLTVEEAKLQAKQGIMEWKFAGNVNLESNSLEKIDIILASAGDYQTLETLAGIDWLKKNVPELKFKYVNINQMNCYGLGSAKTLVEHEKVYSQVFGEKIPVLINFHGYTTAVKQVIFDSTLSSRSTIIGYSEKGSTTTPFNMQVMNETSRWHVALNAIEIARKNNPIIEAKADQLVQILKSKLAEHREYILENGEDLPEILNWKWEE